MNFVDELQRHLEEGAAIDSRRRARQRRVARAAGAVGLAAIVVAGAMVILSDDGPTQVATDWTDPTPLETTTTTRGASARSALPVPTTPPTAADDAQVLESLGLVGSVMVWTGTELLVWGGTSASDSGTVTTSDGILYDLDSGTWRDLPPAPGGPLSEAVGAWTGSEVIICCGNGSDRTGAIAYDPSADAWRELPAPPLSEKVGRPAAIWSDDRFLVIAREEMVAYSPATDSWDVLEPPPTDLSIPSASAVAAGDQIVVWPRRSARSTSRGLVYDLSDDSWAELPEPPRAAWPAAPDVAWTGTELIIVGGRPSPAGGSERLVGARLDWATMAWTALPDVWPEPQPFEGNIGSQSTLWTGDVLLVVAGSLGSGIDPLDSVIATYNPATDQWRRLPSSLDQMSWNPPLVEAGGDVVTVAGGQLRRISVGPELGEPAGSDGFPAAGTLPSVDVPLRGVPLTLVGTNGNGAGVVVLDLNLGLQTIYEPGHHHQLGPGGLTDMAMSDTRALYIWRTDEPTVRFRGGDHLFGDGERLSLGELAQPGEIVETQGPERSVIPLPASNAVWVWETSPDARVARLVGANPEATFEVQFDESYVPRGTSASGGLVLSNDTTMAYIKTDGRQYTLGTGTPVAIAGDELLIQDCTGDECSRRWADLETGRTTRVAGTDHVAWSAPTGPIIPGHSIPLNATSPDGSQILVTATDLSTPADPDSVELLRVDVATMAAELVSLPAGTRPVLATWARDGQSIAVLDGNGITIVDLPTGRADHYPGLIPDGYFILAAG